MVGKSQFSQDVADVICTRIAEGESLRSIIRTSSELPAMSTVFKWLETYPSFAEQYTRAREAQGDALFDEVKDISDSTHRLLPNGMIAPVDPQWAKLQVDTRKWMAGKLRPQVYSDKTLVEHSGSIDLRITDMSREDIILELQALALKGAPVPNTLLSAPIDVEFEVIEPAAKDDEDDWSDVA